jgi:hypothetical protein
MTKWKDCRRLPVVAAGPESAWKYCAKHAKYLPFHFRERNQESSEYETTREDYGFRSMNVFRARLLSDVVQTGRVWHSMVWVGGRRVRILSTCYIKKGSCSGPVSVFMCWGAMLGPPGTYIVHHSVAHLAQTFACSVKIYRQPLPPDSLLQIWI